MKVKGINPIEQNVEKIVLGIAGAALLGVVAMQLLGGSTVEVKTGERVPLDRAYAPVRDEAIRVRAQMTEENPTLPDVQTVDLLAQYRDAANRPVAVRPRLVAMGPATPITGSASGAGDQPILDAVYAAMRVPAPAAPAGYAFRSTIDPTQVARSPELAAIVPVSQPYDKSAITIETTFNGREMQAALRADPDGAAGPQRPIPLRWWQDGLEIIAVRAERQTLRPDGSWSAPEPVRNMPGAINLLNPQPPDERYNPVTIRNAISAARQMAPQILRPRYLGVIAGAPWVPPSAYESVNALQERRPEIDRLITQRREVQRQIAIQQQLLERGPESDRQQPANPGSPESRRDRGNQPQNPRQQPQGEDPAITGIRSRIARLEEELLASEDALKQIGVDVFGRPLETWSEEENALDYALPPLESDAVRIWMHDLHAENGSTYRYRVQVVFNNPFFGNGPALLPDQQSLAAEPFAYGEWSPWGQPVGVERDQYLFVTAASVGDALSATPTAQVEVFQFYYGFWRRGTANLSAGDVVTAALELPAPEMRPIFDLTQPPGPTSGPQGIRPPNELENQPGRELTEQERAEQRRRGNQPGGQPGLPPGPGQPPRPNLPPINALAVPGPEELPPTVTNVVLLDVTTLPGGRDSGLAGVAPREVFQAVLRAPGGRIEVRTPDADRAAPLYRRLRQSATDGLRQGEPEPVPEADAPIVPVLPPPRPERNEPAPGGGGGGGGGGG